MSNLKEIFNKEMSVKLAKVQSLIAELDKDPKNKKRVKELDDALHGIDGIVLQVESIKMIKTVYEAKLLLDPILQGKSEVTSDVIMKLIATHEKLVKLMGEFKWEGKN